MDFHENMTAKRRCNVVATRIEAFRIPTGGAAAVIYQIYPRSFQDTNGDGIGDLIGHHPAPALHRRIWAWTRSGSRPFFTSPMKDFGYDVSDTRDVDPMFGTLGDFDALVEVPMTTASRCMIDLVLSHTSDQHPWFQESRVQPRQPEIRLVCLGRSQARWHAAQQLAVDLRRLGLGVGRRPEQYYLHNFLTSSSRI
jgi:alpha-glucosidase